MRPLTFALAMLISSMPAMAQEPLCRSHDELVAFLATTYGERLMMQGTGNMGNKFEVFVSSGGETWTMVIVNGQRQACMIGAGEDWRFVRPQLEGPKA